MVSLEILSEYYSIDGENNWATGQTGLHGKKWGDDPYVSNGNIRNQCNDQSDFKMLKTLASGNRMDGYLIPATQAGMRRMRKYLPPIFPLEIPDVFVQVSHQHVAGRIGGTNR